MNIGLQQISRIQAKLFAHLDYNEHHQKVTANNVNSISLDDDIWGEMYSGMLCSVGYYLFFVVVNLCEETHG